MEIHNNPYFQVLQNNDFYEIRFPANHTIIIPVLNLDSVVMIRAKRPILGKSIIEFPAGNIDTNESAEECAKRELGEETGIIITDKSRFVKLPEMNPLPARTKNLIIPYFIKINQNEYNSKKQHDNEVSEVFTVKIDEVYKMINNGSLFVSSHIAAFFIYTIHENKLLYKPDYI